MAIITVSREMGSGGIPIAHKAAEKLGYTLVDGEAIKKIAHSYGLSPEGFEKADEKAPAFVTDDNAETEIDFRQIELILLDAALKGNVIIYGRGGQDLLQRINSVLRVRIIAPFEARVESWAEREWLDPELARVLVRRSDQQRAGFIKYYFDRDWEEPINYDLIINTLRLSEDMAVKLICDAIKDKNLVERKSAAKRVLQDLIIQKTVEIQLLSNRILEGLHQYHFRLSVENGMVTLQGHVHNKEKHQEVLAVVRQADGVRGIKDELEIRPYRSEPRDH
jgi:cytidylate kinase